MELGKETHHHSTKNNYENRQAYQDHDFLLINNKDKNVIVSINK